MTRPQTEQLEAPQAKEEPGALLIHEAQPELFGHADHEKRIISYLLTEQENADNELVKASIGEVLQHLEEYTKRAYLFSNDPYVKVVCGLFDMVITENMEPESIDFHKFREIFLKRCVKDEAMDLATVGKLLLMAFKALNLKIHRRLMALEALESQGDEFEELGDFDFLDMELFDDEEAFSYTQHVIASRRPPIEECVRRGGKNIRRATLLELFDAIKSAETDRRENERRYLKMVERRKAQRSLARKKTQEIALAPVKDNIFGDIRLLWDRILSMDKEEVHFNELMDDPSDRLIRVRTFFAILFMAQEGLTRLVQDQPFSDIVLTDIRKERACIVVPESQSSATEARA